MKRVLVVAPSGVAPADRVELGRQALLRAGFEVELPTPPSGPRHYLAGPDDHRAQELLSAIERDDVDLVWALRGGFGAVRTWERLDPARVARAMRRNPRPLVGFSDITVLVNALAAFGAPMVHGPVVTQFADLTEEARAAVLDALTRGPQGPLPFRDSTVLRSGEARGVLRGGNLATLASLVGTSAMPPLHDSVVFLEDVGEPVYRLDRMLCQLRQSGSLAGARALLLGSFSGVAAGELGALEHLLREVGEWFPGPVLTGLRVGHTPDNHAVWVGAEVTVVAGAHVAAAEYLP